MGWTDKMALGKALTTTTLRKVPEITVFFWIIKLFTTALGESVSDYLVHQIDPVIAVILGGIGFVIAMLFQFRVRRYIAGVYWFAATMVAVFGTMVADVVHIVLGVPYVLSVVFFAAALAVIFALWYRTEHTLSIHSIRTPRRELFYWATVVTTFALGTAAGDMTAITLNLGFLDSGALFAILFALPAIAYWKWSLTEVTAFWAAYIVTRPLGASFADWFGRAPDSGGIGFGTGNTSLVLAVLIVVLVGYLTITRKDIPSDQRSLAGR